MRQWVLSVPLPLRFLFASNPEAMTGALGTVYRAIATHLADKQEEWCFNYYTDWGDA